MQLYRNKYRSDSFRLQNWDYGSPGFYYVTICTKHHFPYFGEVVALDNLSGNTRAWDGLRDGIAGTHDYASLPPTAQSAPSPSAPPAHGQRESAVFVKLSAIGKIAYENWLAIPQHFPFVALDEFVVMPGSPPRHPLFQEAGISAKTIQRLWTAVTEPGIGYSELQRSNEGIRQGKQHRLCLASTVP